MNGTEEGDSKHPGGLEALIALPAKYVMSTIGAALSISGFVALVTTQSVKNWVRSHPYPIYLALIVAVLLITGILDYSYNLRRRIAVPSQHDKRFYAAALERLPPNGSVIGWLKHTEITEASIDSFPTDVLHALSKTVEFARTQPVGFDDQRIAGSYVSLTKAITSFSQSVDRWTFAQHTGQFRRTAAPPGTAPSGTSQPPISRPVIDPTSEEETATLTLHHRELVSAYDQFMRTAHARGVDIDIEQ